MAKQKAKRKREARIEGPKTAQEWDELEMRYQAEEARLRVASDIPDEQGGRTIVRALVKRVLEMEHVICTTPAADRRSLDFKLRTFEPDMDDAKEKYAAIVRDVERFLDVLERGLKGRYVAEPSASAGEAAHG